jgi:hypothetical protein
MLPEPAPLNIYCQDCPPNAGRGLDRPRHQRERSACFAEPFEAADEGSQARGVEEAHLAEVGDEVHSGPGRKLPHLFAKHRRGIDVDLAGHLKDGGVADRLDVCPGGTRACPRKPLTESNPSLRAPAQRGFRSAPLLGRRCCARKSHPNGCYGRAMSSSVVTKRSPIASCAGAGHGAAGRAGSGRPVPAGRRIGWMSGIRIGSAIWVSSSSGGGERGWR